MNHEIHRTHESRDEKPAGGQIVRGMKVKGMGTGTWFHSSDPDSPDKEHSVIPFVCSVYFVVKQFCIAMTTRGNFSGTLNA